MEQSTKPAYPEGYYMSLTEWVVKRFNLKAEPEAPKLEQKELVAATYGHIEEVSKLREDVLEGRNFPIASYLRGESSPAAKRRARK